MQSQSVFYVLPILGLAAILAGVMVPKARALFITLGVLAIAVPVVIVGTLMLGFMVAEHG